MVVSPLPGVELPICGVGFVAETLILYPVGH